jgi:hypothetical protein
VADQLGEAIYLVTEEGMDPGSSAPLSKPARPWNKCPLLEPAGVLVTLSLNPVGGFHVGSYDLPDGSKRTDLGAPGSYVFIAPFFIGFCFPAFSDRFQLT